MGLRDKLRDERWDEVLALRKELKFYREEYMREKERRCELERMIGVPGLPPVDEVEKKGSCL